MTGRSLLAVGGISASTAKKVLVLALIGPEGLTNACVESASNKAVVAAIENFMIIICDDEVSEFVEE